MDASRVSVGDAFGDESAKHINRWLYEPFVAVPSAKECFNSLAFGCERSRPDRFPQACHQMRWQIHDKAFGRPHEISPQIEIYMSAGGRAIIQNGLTGK